MRDLLFCHKGIIVYISTMCKALYICHLINHCIIHTYDHVHFVRKCVKEVNTSDFGAKRSIFRS